MVKKGNGPDLRDRCGQLQVSVQVGNALKMYLLSLLDYSAYGRSTMVVMVDSREDLV